MRQIAGTDVFPIGLGAMPMSLSGRPPEEQSIRTIHAALDAGVNLIDTADAYCVDETDVGHNERLIAKALRGRRDGVIVATKGGHTRPGGAWELDGRPEYIKAACEASLKALETDRIDLYQYHRPDPDVPYEETIGAFKELQDEGKVRWIGISNANVEQIELTCSMVDLVVRPEPALARVHGPDRQGRGGALRRARHRLHPVVADEGRVARRRRWRTSAASRPTRWRSRGCSRSARS